MAWCELTCSFPPAQQTKRLCWWKWACESGRLISRIWGVVGGSAHDLRAQKVLRQRRKSLSCLWRSLLFFVACRSYTDLSLPNKSRERVKRSYTDSLCSSKDNTACLDTETAAWAQTGVWSNRVIDIWATSEDFRFWSFKVSGQTSSRGRRGGRKRWTGGRQNKGKLTPCCRPIMHHDWLCPYVRAKTTTSCLTGISFLFLAFIGSLFGFSPDRWASPPLTHKHCKNEENHSVSTSHWTERLICTSERMGWNTCLHRGIGGTGA